MTGYSFARSAEPALSFERAPGPQKTKPACPFLLSRKRRAPVTSSALPAALDSQSPAALSFPAGISLRFSIEPGTGNPLSCIILSYPLY